MVQNPLYDNDWTLENIFIKYGGKIKDTKINYEKDNIFRY